MTARQRCRADSISLNAIAIPAAREPGPLRGHIHHSLDAGHNGAGRVLLHLQGKLDRRELGSRARLPVEWIIGRHVLLDVELAPASASGRPGGEAA